MDDLIRREDAFSYFVTLWECIGTIMDKNEWEDVCMTTANEIPSAQPEIKTDGDTISRQAAIDAIVKWAESHHENPDGDDCIMIILDVPPAHPEIIHCRDCKHHWTFRPYGDFPTETCELEQTFYDANVDFCSLAERRTDEGVDLPTGGD